MSQKVQSLFHVGFQVIEEPDIKAGRKNADFGQGFYLSDNESFSRRWARIKEGMTTYLNRYEMDYEGLNIKNFNREEDWLSYITANRNNQADSLSDYDVVIGPIANDTIYDTFGVLTSGLMNADQALKLLSAGPAYTQIAIKTAKAVKALRFKEVIELQAEEIEQYRSLVKEEEAAFQEQFLAALESINEE